MEKGRAEAHGVALVVDKAFGDKLVPLASRVHVWVIDTPPNRAAAKAVAPGVPGDGATRFLAAGATTFSADDNARPDEIAASVLGIIDLHHGEGSPARPWSFLEVHGADPTPALSALLAAYGFTDVEMTDDGFEARRGRMPD